MSGIETLDPDTWRMLQAFRADPSFGGDVERVANGVVVRQPPTDPEAAWGQKAFEEAEHPRGLAGRFRSKYEHIAEALRGVEPPHPWEMSRAEFERHPNTMWHGTIHNELKDDMVGSQGLHVGTYEAARQALRARSGWDLGPHGTVAERVEQARAGMRKWIGKETKHADGTFTYTRVIDYGPRSQVKPPPPESVTVRFDGDQMEIVKPTSDMIPREQRLPIPAVDAPPEEWRAYNAQKPPRQSKPNYALEVAIREAAEAWLGVHQGGDVLRQARDPSEGPTFWRDSGVNAGVPDSVAEARALEGPGQIPSMIPLWIVGPMTNTPHDGNLRDDFWANGVMRSLLERGKARRGMYYRNVGEDEGSASAVVPSREFLATHEDFQRYAREHQGKAVVEVDPYIREGHPVSGYTRRTLEGEDAAEYLQRLNEAWGHGLSDDEKKAFWLWRTSYGFQKINEALRYEHPDSEIDIGSERVLDVGHAARVPKNHVEGIIERADPVSGRISIRLGHTGNVESFPWHDVEPIPTPPVMTTVGKVVENLDNAMARSPRTGKPLNLYLYRGVRDIQQVFGEDEPMIGDMIHDKGYVSTSTDFGVAWGFSQGNLVGGLLDAPRPAIFQIEVPADIQGGWINAIANDSSNREFVLPRGSTFEITDTDPGGVYGESQVNDFPLIQMRLVPDAREGGKAVALNPDFLPREVPAHPFQESEHPRGVHGRFMDKLSQEWHAAYDLAYSLFSEGRSIGQGHLKEVDEPLQHIVDTSDRGKLPEIVSPEEFDQIAHETGAVVQYHGSNQEKYVDDFMRGGFRVALGVDGSGYYTATNLSVGAHYGDMKQEPGRLIRMMLKPDAKVADWNEISKQAKEAASQVRAGTNVYGWPSTEEGRRAKVLGALLVDPGRYAALQGYDAIRVPQATDSDFDHYIILNRHALIVDRQMYNPRTSGREDRLIPWQS